VHGDGAGTVGKFDGRAGRGRKRIYTGAGGAGSGSDKLCTGTGEAGRRFARGGARGGPKIDAPHVSGLNYQI
jgi:hypothetical protein